MASKRKQSDSSEQNKVGFKALILQAQSGETSDTAQVEKYTNERNESAKCVLQVSPLDFGMPGPPVTVAAASTSNCAEPGSSVTVPSDPSVAASLSDSVDLDIKMEMCDDEQSNDDIYFDDSKSEVNEKKEEEEDVAEEPDNEVEEESTVSARWSKNPIPLKIMMFNKKQQFIAPVASEPYDLFRLFLNDEFLELMVEETNKCATKAENKEWVPIIREEMIIFLGLLLHTGTMAMPRLCDYWNGHYLFNIQIFARLMKRQRFLQILDYLSFSSATSTDDINKIKPAVDNFNYIMNTTYCPSANLIVTQSMGIHCGNVHTETNKPMNSTRMARVHALVEPTGIVLKLAVTHGICKPDIVVAELVNEILDSGHSIYIDEKYNSFPVVISLIKRGTYCTGPIADHLVNLVHKQMRTIVTMEELLNEGSYYNSNGFYLCRVNGKFFVSSQHDGEPWHVSTPRGGIAHHSKPLAMYESVMDVDLNETVMTYYPCRYITLPWYKKAFIHILQVSLVNAYKFHKKFNRFHNFRLEVLENMLPATFSLEDTDKHVLTKITTTKRRERRGQLGNKLVSIDTVRKECRGCRQLKRNKRQSTVYECRQCNGAPGYCLPCFERIHKENGNLT